MFDRFTVTLVVALLVTNPAWAAGDAEPSLNSAPCLAEVIDGFFEVELSADEIDPILVLDRFQRQLRLTPNSQRAALARETFAEMEGRLDVWTFQVRDYRGGILFCGPLGHLRWLKADGTFLKARLRQDYWRNRDETDLRFPLARHLDRLSWVTVVQRSERD